MKIRALTAFAFFLSAGGASQAAGCTLYQLTLDAPGALSAENLSAIAISGENISGILTSGMEAPSSAVSAKEVLAGTQFTLGGIEFDAGPFQVLNNPQSDANWLSLTVYRGFDASNLRQMKNIGSNPLAP